MPYNRFSFFFLAAQHLYLTRQFLHFLVSLLKYLVWSLLVGLNKIGHLGYDHMFFGIWLVSLIFRTSGFASSIFALAWRWKGQISFQKLPRTEILKRNNLKTLRSLRVMLLQNGVLNLLGH